MHSKSKSESGHPSYSSFRRLELCGRLDSQGSRGTLIFTAATAATRGNVTTSAFAAGKFATRGLSQSLAKEFGKQNIHVRINDLSLDVLLSSLDPLNPPFGQVAHVIIDGAVLTDTSTPKRLEANPNYVKDEDIRLDPTAIAEVRSADS